jgi:hypothetical protein
LQKDTQNKGKIKRYLLLKCKTIKTLLFEQEETNKKGRAKPLHARESKPLHARESKPLHASLKNPLIFLSNLPFTSFWGHHHTLEKKKP